MFSSIYCLSLLFPLFYVAYVTWEVSNYSEGTKFCWNLVEMLWFVLPSTTHLSRYVQDCMGLRSKPRRLYSAVYLSACDSNIKSTHNSQAVTRRSVWRTFIIGYPVKQTREFFAGHEKMEKKGGFHARHEKKGGFHARIFNGRLCLSQLKRRSGLLKAAVNLDRYWIRKLHNFGWNL